MDRFIGLDVHLTSCTVAVVSASGKRLRDFPVETHGETLLDAVRSVSGKRHLVLEEGTQSAWLYDLLRPHVDELVVTSVRGSRGPKSDAKDAYGLAEKLRIGGLDRIVYQAPSEFRALRQLAVVHRALTGNRSSSTARPRAKYRATTFGDRRHQEIAWSRGRAMSIVDLGALGEFVGAIAVVATLIYLTIQVRQSKEAMKENARLARAAVSKQTFEIFAEHRRHIIENADVARIWREGLAGRDLDENDRTRFEQVGEEYIFGMNVAFNLGRAAGYERVLEGMPHTLALTMHKGPGMRVIWKRVRGALTTVGDSSFADAVDTAFEALSAQPRKTQR